ncbi:CbrC family protein [Streptomyces sp. NPDC091027]|uniref:CbrC family protein n=1 Tax=Streptomyces sp. NPDC091027 TaxID=3365971 RepID=UPI0037F9CF29
MLKTQPKPQPTTRVQTQHPLTPPQADPPARPPKPALATDATGTGSAGEFPDTTGLDGVSKDVLQEATRRTPGFHARQHPRWLVHCRTAAALVSEVGYTELAARPDALTQSRTDMRLHGRHNDAQLERLLTHPGESATAMLFHCTVCRTHLTHLDAS